MITAYAIRKNVQEKLQGSYRMTQQQQWQSYMHFKVCGMCLGSGWSRGRAGMECDVERGGRRVQTRLSLIAQVVITRGRKEH